MTPRRVVITGIGAITPIGSGAGGLWEGVMANRSAVRAIDRFDASPFPSRIAAQIDDFDPADHLDARRARRLDRFSALSVAAARMAFHDAALDEAASHSARSSTRASSPTGCAVWHRPWPWLSSAVPEPATWPSISA
jgi:3-oxoacyl-[acyl-carrier-protein] synthase II